MGAALLAGCQGIIADGGGTFDGSGPTGSPTEPTDPTDPDYDACSSQPEVFAAPRGLRRLTQLEFNNTVRDLLGDTSAPAAVLGEDEEAGGFAANSIAPMDVSRLDALVELTGRLAETALVANGDAWLPCDHSNTDCVRSFIADFGRRAFRRPLASDEVTEFVNFYEAERGTWGADVAIEMLVQAVLLSPEFIYHVELGEPRATGEGLIALTQHELASALSYFLWSTMPDAALLTAADAGELDSPEALEAQVRRMVDDPMARATIGEFHHRWLHIQDSDDIARDTELFPWWTPELAAAVADETRRFAERVYEEEGTLRALFTASYTVGTPELAALYGAEPPAADGRIELDPDQRSGLLTLSEYLTSHARPTENDWIHRGLVVRRQVLCGSVPAPPANVDLGENQNDGRRLENPICSACHRQMDPIGKGFDEYDPTGRFMVDAAIDATGEIEGNEPLGLPATFDGAISLAGSLAESPAVEACYATQWFRFAMKRADSLEDGCQVQRLAETFASTGGDIRELLVAMTLMDAFRHRSTEEGE